MKHTEVMQQALEWFEWFHACETDIPPARSLQIKHALKEALKSAIDTSFCMSELKTELHKLNKNLAEVEGNCYKDCILSEPPSTLQAGGMPPEVEDMYEASMELAKWLSAALDDPKVCDEYKEAINNWFNCAMPYPVAEGKD